jgi:hypothetical protein
MTNQITQKFIDLLGPITDDKAHFSTFSHSAVAGGHNVTEMSKVQKELTEQILKDHFKLKEINWMELPSGLDKNQKPIVAQTIKLTDDEVTMYEGKTGYVYMIFFSPKMYDPTYPSIPVKDGCTFGPLVYNPENFEPYRTITITFNPTHPDQTGNKEDQDELMKQQLRDKLEKILEDPDAYMPEAHRVAMIRMAIV